MSKTKKKKVLIIADYFIEKNRKDKKGLTNKKLQKLLYYAQAWSIVFNEKKIFNESIQAWVHGPAIPVVYAVFRNFGRGEIKVKVDVAEFSELTEKEKNVLDNVWGVYGGYDADYLEALTHSEAPWQEARKNLTPYESCQKAISPTSMKKYYGEKIKTEQHKKG